VLPTGGRLFRTSFTMAHSRINLDSVLERLEQLYGPQKPAGPSDPYEMIVYVNCGYPATDVSCSKGFEALKREVGLKPENILEAPKAKLAKLMRLGGIVPELRAEKLKEIARIVKADLGGDLKAELNKWMLEEKKESGKGIRGAKNVLQKFPVIGEPGAEKILLFSKLAPVAAVPSAFVGVPMRLWFGETEKNYAADYRAAREILDAELPETFEARQRAYLLLKKHGQEICKRATPKCEICPLTGQCAYFQSKAADINAE
jgi:endonuclease-3